MAANPLVGKAPMPLSDLPALKGTSKKVAAMKKLMQEKEGISDQLKKNAKASTWFDPDAPSTRLRRQRLRANYEGFCRECLEITDIKEMYNADTFVTNCKMFLEMMAQVSTGRIEEEIRADMLWQHKDALYWFAVRGMDNFPLIFQGWHAQLVSHIHLLAKQYKLSGAHRHKSLLGNPELHLLFRHLLTLQFGVENAMQHYVAWVMSYMTGVRPGSITVCPGYEMGASLGAEGLTRDEDATMRWKDCQFVQLEGISGIAVKVTYKFLKGGMNPHERRMVMGAKTFTFLPSRRSDHELDLAALLVSLAFSRGLFPFETIEELYASDLVFIPTKPNVAEQAVFVQSSAAGGEIKVEQPMKEHALNPMLQKMCTAIGLMERNTMYSFRRTAITEVQRAEGTEFARQFANHAPDSHSILSYDVTGLSDVDINALRIGDKEGAIPRETIREAYNQIKMSMAPPEVNLEEELEIRVEAKMRSEQKYIDAETQLDNVIQSICDLLDIDPLPVNPLTFRDYKKALQSRGSPEALSCVKALDDANYQRKLVRKNLRKSLRPKVKKAYQEEHQAALKLSKRKAAASQTIGTGRGRQPAALREAIAGSGAIDMVDDSTVQAIEDLPDELHHDANEDESVDEDAIDESQSHPRAAPTFWQKLNDEVVIMPEAGEQEDSTEANDEEASKSLETLIKFVKTFSSLRSIPNADLKCILCALDPTISQKMKDTRWTLMKLKAHLTSSVHLRASQLERAVVNTQQGEVTCSICGEEMLAGVLVNHVEEFHPDHA